MRTSQIVLAVVALAFAAGCASGAKVKQRAEVVRGDVDRARKSGAYKCAPKQLALAEFNLDASAIELEEGTSNKALKHVKAAEENAREALELSKDCGPKTVIIKPKKKIGIVLADKDGDGVVDNEDQCVDDPGPRENQGCPDTDGDGIFDNLDRCKVDPEDKDGFQDEDGCPDPDNDQDGILDPNDKCPIDPGTLETQGCPDQDKDTIADAEDKCPLEPGPRDSNAGVGCPPQYKLVVRTKDKIEIKQKILFATGKATILGKSFELLKEVAQVFKDEPRIKVRIEGHTDSVGNDKFNQRLSDMRAKSVRDFLIKEGIEGDRLEAVGYGESRPIESNATKKGREANRRVEFFITEQ